MKERSLQLTVAGHSNKVHVTYLLTNFDGRQKSSFGKLYLITSIAGDQHIDIAEVITEDRRFEEEWIRKRAEENMQLYFQA